MSNAYVPESWLITTAVVCGLVIAYLLAIVYFQHRYAKKDERAHAAELDIALDDARIAREQRDHARDALVRYKRTQEGLS